MPSPGGTSQFRWTDAARDTFNLRARAGDTAEQIAKRLGNGCTPHAVRSFAYRFKVSLKRPPRGPRAGITPDPKRPLREFDLFEAGFVRAKRAANVPWSALSKMLRKPEQTLRGLYGG